MNTVFIDSEGTDVELLDLTSDDNASFTSSPSTLRASSNSEDSDDTFTEDDPRELKFAQFQRLTDDILSVKDVVATDSHTGEEAIMLKRKPISNIDIPIMTIPVSKLREPALCKEYPDRRDEILQLFLKRTTFTAEVWTNYTAASWRAYKDGQEFFHDTMRVRDCGKLQLGSRGALKRIQLLNPRKFEMMKVKLVIGTPFRPLFYLLLVMCDGSLVVEKEDWTNGMHAELHRFVSKCCQEIQSVGLKYGKRGITVQDLEFYASLFVSKH